MCTRHSLNASSSFGGSPLRNAATVLASTVRWLLPLILVPVRRFLLGWRSPVPSLREQSIDVDGDDLASLQLLNSTFDASANLRVGVPQVLDTLSIRQSLLARQVDLCGGAHVRFLLFRRVLPSEVVYIACTVALQGQLIVDHRVWLRVAPRRLTMCGVDHVAPTVMPPLARDAL